MSMMINVDHRVNKMNRTGATIRDYVRDTLPAHYDVKLLKTIYKELIEDAKNLNEKLGSGNHLFEEKDVINEALKVITSRTIEVRVLNSSKDDKLDYAKNPSMKVVAVGGNKLSRGLTLDGLMVTFYLRESKQYDTLLQMGRWFGYRRGYEDLVRIYTSESLWRNFKDLAIIELEFRESIREMVKEGKTPKEFAIGVRQILGLLPTSKNRLGAAVLEESFAGKQVSVTRLPLEKPEIIDVNVEVSRQLIAEIIRSGYSFEKVDKGDMPSLLARDVSSKYLLPFLVSFNIAKNEDGAYIDFDKDDLLKYINKRIRKGDFGNWNVAIISIARVEDECIIHLPGDINIRAVNRARMKVSPQNGAYNIKAISDKRDRMIDLLPNARNEYDGRVNPLLLIYFVNRRSKPMQDRERSSRQSLYHGIPVSHRRDPVSFAIIFPGDSKTGGRFIQPILR
jgi:hypothetical protein